MTFAEAIECLKSGHPIRRESWPESWQLKPESCEMTPEYGGSANVGWVVRDIEATDWRRVDKLDADAADRIIGVAHALWDVSIAIQDAVDNPGKRVEFPFEIDRAVIDRISSVCHGLTMDATICSMRPTNGIAVLWQGDPPHPTIGGARANKL